MMKEEISNSIVCLKYEGMTYLMNYFVKLLVKRGTESRQIPACNNLHCSEKYLSFNDFNHSNALQIKLNPSFAVSTISPLRIKILHECCV